MMASLVPVSIILHDAPLIASGDDKIARRSANYKPSIWDQDFVLSLKNDYIREIDTKRAEKLKEHVRRMFGEASGSLSSLLRLIDTIQRLGISYHFVDEIKGVLDTITSIKENKDVNEEEDDLFSTALRFRLLRQHGYEISQGVFERFKEEMKRSSASGGDIEGMLSVYEASFYAFEGEEILDEVQEFTGRLLKEYLDEKINNVHTSCNPNSITMKLVSHALELPLLWTVQRVEARWFIDTYEMMTMMMQLDNMDDSLLLLEFAKLDFNMVQAIYQDDLKYVSRWWKELGFTETLSFARDRWLENFFWSVGYNFEPELGNCRRQLTKANCLITTIDDIYDVYGSLDELKIFTDAVERWDINTLGNLPDYMKKCFLVLYDTTNEMAHENLKKGGLDIILYLKSAWAALCKCYLVEAKWYYSAYTPTLEEYMNNGVVTGTLNVLASHAYFLLGNDTTNKDALDCLKNYSSHLIRWTSLVCRLSNDLGTSTEEIKRGDAPKAIQCYMQQAGVSESNAREHIEQLINDLWKKINKGESCSILAASVTDTMKNITRMAHVFYQHGDGLSLGNPQMKDRITSILLVPIPIEDNTRI